jgi:hypothetical protein
MSMKLSPAVTTCVLSCLTLGFASVAFGQEMSKGSAPLHDVNGPADFRSSVRPLLAKYCTGCHGTAKPKGGLNFVAFDDGSSAQSHRKTWERVREYVEGGVMPPEERPQPSGEEIGRLTNWIKSD